MNLRARFSLPQWLLGSLLNLTCGLLISCGGSGDLSQAVAEQHANYRVVDLSDGSSTYRSSLDDVASNPAYRDQLLVLRHVPESQAALGATTDEPFIDDDEQPPHQATIAEHYLGIFELTRAQWQRLTPGNTPWIDLGITDSDVTHPATGMSLIDAEDVLKQWSTTHGLQLTLPTGNSWESAARCTGGAFGFDPTQPSVSNTFARTRESLSTDSGTTTGTAPVGQRRANAWGLFDMHGNAAELTAGRDPDAFAEVRGGSWYDPIATARATNRVALPPQSGHPLVGLRVVLLP